jgi:hypothetical protein
VAGATPEARAHGQQVLLLRFGPVGPIGLGATFDTRARHHLGGVFLHSGKHVGVGVHREAVDACPRRSDTTLTGTPVFWASVACVWRRPFIEIGGSLARSTIRANEPDQRTNPISERTWDLKGPSFETAKKGTRKDRFWCIHRCRDEVKRPPMLWSFSG